MTGRSVRITPPALHRTPFGEASRAVSKYQSVQSVGNVRRYDTGISPDPRPCDVAWRLIAAGQVVDLIRSVECAQMCTIDLECSFRYLHLEYGRIGLLGSSATSRQRRSFKSRSGTATDLAS